MEVPGEWEEAEGESEAGGWGSVETAPLQPSLGLVGTAGDHSESVDAATPTINHTQVSETGSYRAWQELTDSLSLSMMASRSSKCFSLISSFFICVSTNNATRDLIFLSSTLARCYTHTHTHIHTHTHTTHTQHTDTHTQHTDTQTHNTQHS